MLKLSQHYKLHITWQLSDFSTLLLKLQRVYYSAVTGVIISDVLSGEAIKNFPPSLQMNQSPIAYLVHQVVSDNLS